MKNLLILLLLCSFLLPASGQDNGGTGPKEQSVKKELKLNKEKRREGRAKRKLEKAERKKIKKHHKRIQTKKVRKRMKESKSTALKNHQHQRDPFFKRIFKKKSRAKGKPRKKD